MTRSVFDTGTRAVLATVTLLVLGGLDGCSGHYVPRRFDGESMLPLISPGDKFFLDTSEKARNSPRDGDVIAFQHGNYTLVRRVLATSGETISGVDRKIVRNGEVVSEPYLVTPVAADAPLTPTFPPQTVPAGELFVLGDNRDFSLDSRQAEFGTVRISDVVGKYKLTYWHASRGKK